jgi:hypothetical protein
LLFLFGFPFSFQPFPFFCSFSFCVFFSLGFHSPLNSLLCFLKVASIMTKFSHYQLCSDKGLTCCLMFDMTTMLHRSWWRQWGCNGRWSIPYTLLLMIPECAYDHCMVQITPQFCFWSYFLLSFFECWVSLFSLLHSTCSLVLIFGHVFSFLFWVWGFCLFMFGDSIIILSGDHIMKFVQYIMYILSHIYVWQIPLENLDVLKCIMNFQSFKISCFKSTNFV